jgi:hypothetical protein
MVQGKGKAERRRSQRAKNRLSDDIIFTFSLSQTMSNKIFSVSLCFLFLIYCVSSSPLEFRKVSLKSKLNGGCITPFGQIVGKDVSGVPGISNCNDSYVSNADSFIQTKFGPVYSGMQWQVNNEIISVLTMLLSEHIQKIRCFFHSVRRIRSPLAD